MWFISDSDEDDTAVGDGWKVVDTETSSDADVGQVEVIDEWELKESTPEQPDQTGPGGRTAPSTQPDDSTPREDTVVVPEPEPDVTGPDPGAFPRGTFVFPAADETFVQLLEVCAQNGATDTAETAYVLIGDNHYQPTRVFALHVPDLYEVATIDKLISKIGEMAGVIDAQLEEPPKLFAFVHTHPSGSTEPSPMDRRGTRRVRETFARELGMDDFEYFLGVHALGGEVQGEVERRDPSVSGSGVYWYGESRRHELAVFDIDYTPVNVRCNR